MSSQALIMEKSYQTFPNKVISQKVKDSNSCLLVSCICAVGFLAISTTILGALLLRNYYWFYAEIDCTDPKHAAFSFSFIGENQDFIQERYKFSERKPNILVFLADDLGYGDLASYGHPTQPWGPLDELASNGIRFTQFYADALCSPSRAQFLTGRLPVRVGLTGFGRVFNQGSSGGLPDSEITIAELLRDAGYATGMNGKWHLGINCEKNDDGCHLPFHHGFDFIGTYFPLTNKKECDTTGVFVSRPDPRRCFLYRGKSTSPWQAPAYRENLTETLVLEAKDFIEKNQKKPWFFYFASPQIHDSLYYSKKFKGSTSRGEVGDTIAEMNWAAGELVKHLISLSLAKETLFFFFSDNGALAGDCLEAGTNGILRGAKAGSWEGGHRVPALAWWPGKVVPQSVSHDVLTSADLFPTFANVAGLPLPTDRHIDGIDISNILLGNENSELQSESKLKIEQRPIFYYCNRKLMAVRHGKFKGHYWTWINPSRNGSQYCSKTHVTSGNAGIKNIAWFLDCSDRHMIKQAVPMLFDLESDPSEAYPLDPEEFRAAIQDLEVVVNQHRAGLNFSVPEQVGLLGRPSLVPCCTRNGAKNCYCNNPEFPML